MSNEPLIDIQEIMELIPHRYPILLVDKVISIEPGESIVGVKNVTFNEPHFMGHFPDKPIMPGVLIIEALAQAGAIMVMKTDEFSTGNNLVYFMSIDGAKFRKPVVPGDTVELHISKIQNRGPVWKLDAVAKVNGQKVAEAILTAMIVKKEDE